MFTRHWSFTKIEEGLLMYSNLTKGNLLTIFLSFVVTVICFICTVYVSPLIKDTNIQLFFLQSYPLSVQLSLLIYYGRYLPKGDSLSRYSRQQKFQKILSKVVSIILTPTFQVLTGKSNCRTHIISPLFSPTLKPGEIQIGSP